VLTPSRPGYGSTPLNVGQSAEKAAEAFIALLDSLQIQSCSVIAISGGGPTGPALAASFPKRVTLLVLEDAITFPENRPDEPDYKNQTAFYGLMHNLTWGMLGLMSQLSPRAMARQTLAILSTKDPDDGLKKLSEEGI
jgi:pimeloyl-ACP methyl ester carboxylesterase